MPTYTVKAPDGKTITLEGPAGASQEEVIAQAQALYRPTPASARVNKPKPAPARPDPQKAAALQRYNTMLQMVVGKAKTPEEKAIRQRVFESDPRVQQIRKTAGLAPVTTRKQEVRQVARAATPKQRARELGTAIGSQQNRVLDSASAGLARGLFGVPERLAAAYLRFAPTALTGNDTNASYDNILEVVRAANDAKMGANPGTALVGEIGSSIIGGGVLGKMVAGGGRRLAASAIPAAQRVGRLVQGATTLQKGQRARNAGKIALGGATGGATYAAGTGNDVGEGAVIGAVAAPAVAGGVKLAQVASRPFRDVLRLSTSGQILSRLTTATRDQLERRAAQYRQATGAEPTLFEMLPLADRNKILKTAVVGKDNVVEQTSEAIRRRAANLGPEMSNRAREILAPQRQFVERGLRTDLTRARGGQALPEDEALAARAMESPTDMSELRDVEARAIMEPFDNAPVVGNLEDLFPSVPNPAGGAGLSTDPELETVIRNVSGLIRRRAPNAGVTVGDITDMISRLRPMLGNGGNDAMVAERAINRLHDVLDNAVPDAGAAAREMTEAYAGRSRMMEGMKEGSMTRLRDDVQVGTNRGQARAIRNAYDTAEGAGGRSLGQGNRILTDLSGSPEEALRATIRQSRGSTSRALAQNIGDAEADALTAAARAQDESAQALAAASNKAQSGSGDGADAEMLVTAIAGLHPSSFITTKAGAMRKLVDMTYIPESRARTIVDMIFSQDPAMMQRALRAVGNAPNGAKFVQTLAGTVSRLAAGVDADAIDVPMDEPGDAPSVEADLAGMEESSDVPSVEDDLAGMEGEGGDYAAMLEKIYQQENPDLIDLVQRVKGQESGGSHFDENGRPIQSSAGAIGVMQVMPDTAPEAAQLAGLPWDPDAYRNDPAYNEMLGIAYLSQMLRKYDGDVDRALAAYNAGPGAVDDALAYGENWLEVLPAETQDYVARVG